MARLNHAIDVVDLSEQIKALLSLLNRAAAYDEVRRARAEVEGEFEGEFEGVFEERARGRFTN